MAKNKNNAPAVDEDTPDAGTENPGADAGTQDDAEPKQNDSKKGKKEFQFRHTSDASFKSDIIIFGEKYEMVCKNGIISTKSDILANHLRGIYSEVR